MCGELAASVAPLNVILSNVHDETNHVRSGSAVDNWLGVSNIVNNKEKRIIFRQYCYAFQLREMFFFGISGVCGVEIRVKRASCSTMIISLVLTLVH